MTKRLFLRDVIQLFSSWWNVDRIRIPTSEGSLLQLAAGDRLLIGSDVLVVLQRQAKVENERLWLRFTLGESESETNQPTGKVWYLEHHASKSDLWMRDGQSWTLIDPLQQKMTLFAEAITLIKANE